VKKVVTLICSLLLIMVACGEPEAQQPEASQESSSSVAPQASASAAVEPAAEGGGEGSPSGEEASSVEAVLAQVEGMQGSERRDELIRLAADSGAVKLYASMTPDVGEVLLPAFEEDTGVPVELFRADSDSVRIRLRQEADAGSIGADVVEVNGIELALLSQDDLFVPHEPPNIDELIDGVVQPGGWTATRLNIFTVAVNTNEVAEDERPQTYQDLADPGWDGRLVMEMDDQIWYKEVYEYLVAEEGLTEEQADQVFADMAEGAAFVSGHSTMRQLLMAGEYAVASSDYSYGIVQAAAEGAPVDWQPPVEPLFATPNGIALIKDATNPAGAVLFYEWWLSDGQEHLPDLAIDAVRADLQEVGEADLRLVDVADYVAEAEEWTTRYHNLAGTGEIVPE